MVRMKIGIFDPYLDTMSGGEKYMLTLGQCLAKEHTVTLFWDIQRKEEIFEAAKKRFDFDLSPLTITDSIFEGKVALATRLQKSREYDAIIVLSDGSIPLVLCDLIVHFQSPVEWVKTGLKTRLKLSRIKRVICNSEFTKSFIDRKFHCKSQVIYPPVIIQGEYSEAEKTNSILNVGRFGINQAGSSYKKQDVLAETFKNMVDQGLTGWELVFVMSVQEKDIEAAKGFVDACKGYPIKFSLNPTNDQLWEEYKKARIYWHASGFGEDLTSHPDRAEHFGISTVEAMGMGAVPIVFKAGGQPEIVVDHVNGRLWQTTEELQAITTEVINNSKVYATLVEEAIRSVDTFSKESFCREFTSLLA